MSGWLFIARVVDYWCKITQLEIPSFTYRPNWADEPGLLLRPDLCIQLCLKASRVNRPAIENKHKLIHDNK